MNLLKSIDCGFPVQVDNGASYYHYQLYLSFKYHGQVPGRPQLVQSSGRYVGISTNFTL